jgi:sec-independent protein translocase protein TatC
VARARRVKPDEQLTLVEHLDELRTRIVVVLAVFTLAAGICFYKSEALLKFLAGPLPDNIQNKGFLQTGPLDAILTSLAISIYGGLLLTLPIATYQLYAFVIPAFAEEHHRSVKPLLMMIPGLFVAGVIFAWYLVVPPALDFLFTYNADAFVQLPRAKDYIQFVMLTLLAMGIVFELPVVMLILARLRIISSAFMRGIWRIAIVVLAVVAMLLPGFDPISFIVEFIPLLVLYGISYFLVLMVERGREEEPDPEPLT